MRVPLDYSRVQRELYQRNNMPVSFATSGSVRSQKNGRAPRHVTPVGKDQQRQKPGCTTSNLKRDGKVAAKSQHNAYTAFRQIHVAGQHRQNGEPHVGGRSDTTWREQIPPVTKSSAEYNQTPSQQYLMPTPAKNTDRPRQRSRSENLAIRPISIAGTLESTPT